MSMQEKDIDKIVSSYKMPFKKTKEDAWNEIISNVKEESISKEKSPIFINSIFFKIAASVIILIAISWVIVNSSYKEYYTELGDTLEITLPDNSKVLINSDTYISYSKLLWRFNRKVELNGEAYFKVTSGKKFNVVTPIAQVCVLGTEFNTFSRDNLFETKCYSGKVQIHHQNNKVILTKGKALEIDKELEKSNQFTFDYINKKDWRDGEFFFEKKSLQFVFNELGRQYNVKISISESIKERLYTGYFSNQNLEESLMNVCLPMQLEFKVIDEKTIMINEM